MDKITLKLPDFKYKTHPWVEHDNVTIEGRASEFEEQNMRYFKAGYTTENSKYLQCFEFDDEIHNFCRTLFPRYSVSIMKQAPGQTLPSHEDTFYKFAKTHDVDPYACCRVNIFLEDWQSGHYFEINEKSVLHWKRGDAIIILRDEPHLSGNMGLTTKYTMQVTGVRDEFTGC